MDSFGLDIGSHRIKIIQLQKSGQSFRLLSFGNAVSTSKGLLSDTEGDLTSLATIVKKLYQEANISTKNVIASLPQDQVFTQVITLPNLSEDELISALKWEAEQFIPIPLSEATISHQVIGKFKENAKEKLEVLLAAAPNRLIDKIMMVLKAAGLNPISIEIEIAALSRSLVATGNEPMMIVDFGAKATDIAVIENKQIIFVRSLPTAGEALTRAVASSLGLDPRQAEAYKQAYGADPQKLEGKMVEAMRPVIDSVIKEIEKIVQFHQIEKKKTISRVILAGGTASLPDMASILVEKLSLEVQIANPFSQVEKTDLLSKIPKKEIPLYSIAVGLAMKEVNG